MCAMRPRPSCINQTFAKLRPSSQLALPSTAVAVGGGSSRGAAELCRDAGCRGVKEEGELHPCGRASSLVSAALRTACCVGPISTFARKRFLALPARVFGRSAFDNTFDALLPTSLAPDSWASSFSVGRLASRLSVNVSTVSCPSESAHARMCCETKLEIS